MTAYRFRVKFDPDPTSLWRDIVVGVSAIDPDILLSVVDNPDRSPTR